MAKEICTIFLGNGVLDNDYTIYSDGTVKHFYDRNSFSLNNETMLTVDDIDAGTKKKLLEKCPKESKDKLKKMLKM